LRKTASPKKTGPVAIATFATIVNPALGIGQHSDLLLMCQGLLVHDFGMLFCYEWRCCGWDSVNCFTGL